MVLGFSWSRNRGRIISPLFADDADAIADPLLRDLYKLARKKATA